MIFFIFLSCSSVDTKKNQSEEAMELVPSISLMDDGGAEFSLIATRFADVPNEYLPNSEDFRVEIFSAKGNLIWNSNFGMNYLQVIMNVKPEKVGENYKYSIEWNGQTNSGSRAAAGNYTANLTIPAKPKHYTSTIQFQWK